MKCCTAEDPEKSRPKNDESRSVKQQQMFGIDTFAVHFTHVFEYL